jgi:hypothetical protein
MVLPTQELSVITGMHALHDHKALARAVFKSLRGDSVHSATPQGYAGPCRCARGAEALHLCVRVRARQAIREQDDGVLRLAGAPGRNLSSVRPPHGGLRPQYGAARPPARPPSCPRACASRHSPTATVSPFVGADGARRATGHKIVPVFVFSLLGFPPEALVDRAHLFAACVRRRFAGQQAHSLRAPRSSNDYAIVLQTAGQPVFVPFFNELGAGAACGRGHARTHTPPSCPAREGVMSLDPRSTTRHVVASLLQVRCRCDPGPSSVRRPLG